MASALWSSPSYRILDFPARYMVRFMANHHMLQATDRPQWRVVCGRLVQLRAGVDPRLARSGAQRLRGAARGARCHGRARGEPPPARSVFDQVVLACHSDQALALLDEPAGWPSHRAVAP